MSYHFTFAVEVIDFCFTLGFTLSSVELKIKNSYSSPDAVGPRKPLRSLLNILRSSRTQFIMRRM